MGFRKFGNYCQDWLSEHVVGETIIGVVRCRNYSDASGEIYSTMVEVCPKTFKPDTKPVRIYFPGQAKEERGFTLQVGEEYEFRVRAPVGNGMLNEQEFHKLHRQNPKLRFGRDAFYRIHVSLQRDIDVALRSQRYRRHRRAS